MDNPQEPQRARIVPLFPRETTPPPPSPRRPARTRLRLSDASPEETADRLLRIEAVSAHLNGEEDGVDHLRAVDLAVSSGAFYPNVPTEDVPAAAARRGLSTLEIMLQTPGEYDPAFIRIVADNAKAAGVSVRSLHTMESLHPVLSPYPRRAAEGRELFAKAIDAAATLGADVLVWHGPPRREVATHDGWERFIEVTGELARQCGEAGVTLALENVGRCALGHVRDVTAFAKRLGEIGSQKEIGFVFDPFQAAEAGANPFMLLAAMGNRVVNVHISDYSEADPTARHLPPGDGDLPWSALIRAIAGSGYSGPLVVEGHLGEDDEVITRVREHLTPLFRSVFPFSPDARRHEDGELSTVPELPAGVREGIALFNQRRFYEQHEVIEHEWHAERGPIRALYQGILQIGVGFFHTQNGNYRGAVALLTDGIAKVSRFQPTALGIDTARLVREASACLDDITGLGDGNIAAFAADTIPQIHSTDR